MKTVDLTQNGCASLQNTAVHPPLKWAGGKRWLVPYMRSIWNIHRSKQLVEPFCGGLAIALGLLPDKALLNDINPHAINFYKWLQQGLNVQLSMENKESSYYEHRHKFNQAITSEQATTKEAAELFYYLNRTCYNGLCRFNRKGGFNVPFGKYKTINYVTDFSKYQKIFSNWKFVSNDFAALEIEPSDFIYADPPYDVEFTQYAKEDFNWEDQVRLAQWLAKHRGPTVLSNQATSRIITLYEKLGFCIHYLEAPRMISCTGDRTKAREILATRRL